MGLTHAEFMRSLPSATDGLTFSHDAGHIRIDAPSGKVEIELGPQRVRRVGSLVLPTMSVTLRFSGFTKRQMDAFMERFDLHFHRGGG
jgi:hypothetical protein